MTTVFGPEGIGIALAGATLGVFVAREFNVNKLLLLAIGLLMTVVVRHPVIQLAGAVIVAIEVSRYIGEQVYNLS